LARAAIGPGLARREPLNYRFSGFPDTTAEAEKLKPSDLVYVCIKAPADTDLVQLSRANTSRSAGIAISARGPTHAILFGVARREPYNSISFFDSGSQD
jgi:hypothetical protein